MTIKSPWKEANINIAKLLGTEAIKNNKKPAYPHKGGKGVTQTDMELAQKDV